jgi:hypothetical protein
MIVITRNGKTTVLTGWRAWLFAALAYVVAFAVLALVTFVVLGVAITIGTILLLLVPLAIGFAILAPLFTRRTS